MNYDKTLNDLAETIKDDKDIRQPWRNKAMARVQEAQAFVRMGKTTSNLTPPEAECTCPAGGMRASCPVHGNGVPKENVDGGN